MAMGELEGVVVVGGDDDERTEVELVVEEVDEEVEGEANE